jgi:hypothetical protein
MFQEDHDHMAFSPITSSHLRGVDYDKSAQILLILFSDRSIYRYHNVPERLYRQMINAQPHPWSAVGRELRNKVRYDGTRIS